MGKPNQESRRNSGTAQPEIESYFKIGVSGDYILIRDDFPIARIAPGDFVKLCKEMFRRNEEALHDGK